MEHSLDKKDNVKRAVNAAESVLHIFEKTDPEDLRPRKAIEAAKAWLKDPSEINAAAAATAATAAYSASSAASYAAYSASYSAYSAASYAAYSASYSAYSAAAYAAATATAAYSASVEAAFNDSKSTNEKVKGKIII